MLGTAMGIRFNRRYDTLASNSASVVHVAAEVRVAVRVLFFVEKLNLHAGMLNAIVLAEDCVSSFEDALLLAVLVAVEGDMTRHAHLQVVQGPDVKVMYSFDSLDEFKILDHFVRVDVPRRSLQHYHQALPEGQSGRVEHNNREEVGTDGINHPEVGPGVHNAGCD